MLTRQHFDYSLPPELIAQAPANPRDSSRLLVADHSGNFKKHAIFRDLPEFLRPGDLLIRNDTKVIPVRIFGKKEKTGGKVELLLAKHLPESTDPNQPERWEVLTRPGIKTGQVVVVDHPQTNQACRFTCIGEMGFARIMTTDMPYSQLLPFLGEVGYTPLPPYINSETSEDELRTQYQTWYAKHPGSAAAPTAGLHFTAALDSRLEALGVTIANVTLHVGIGTFMPVKTTTITEHHMHSEQFSLSPETVAKIAATKAAGGRVIAVGTTTIRVLESCWNETTNQLEAKNGDTAIFIYPPRRFNVVDGLITNFHLPESTLLMLISAFTTVPNTTQPFTRFIEAPIGQSYLEAIKEKYRFFSFGDAMLLL